MNRPMRASSSGCVKVPMKRPAANSDEIISSMTSGCSSAELWLSYMREEWMEIEEFNGKLNSMPSMMSKKSSKMPRSLSAERQQSTRSGVMTGHGGSGLAEEGAVVSALAESADMGAVGAGGVGASVTAVEVEANVGSSNKTPYPAAVSGDEEFLSADLGSGLA